MCTCLPLHLTHKHHGLYEGSGQVSLFTIQPQHLAPCLHTESTKEYGVSNKWINGWKRWQIELGEHHAGALLPFSFYFDGSGLPCQNQRAWVCGEDDVPFPVPSRGSWCFPKIHVVIVPAVWWITAILPQGWSHFPGINIKPIGKETSIYCTPTMCQAIGSLIWFPWLLCKANNFYLYK